MSFFVRLSLHKCNWLRQFFYLLTSLLLPVHVCILPPSHRSIYLVSAQGTLNDVQSTTYLFTQSKNTHHMTISQYVIISVWFVESEAPGTSDLCCSVLWRFRHVSCLLTHPCTRTSCNPHQHLRKLSLVLSPATRTEASAEGSTLRHWVARAPQCNRPDLHRSTVP
jgi:hypothetical protein